MSPETPSRKEHGLLIPNIDHNYLNFKEGHSYAHINSNNNNNINNNNVSKFPQRNGPLLHQASLPSSDGNGVASQSLLAPLNFYPRERRHSTSSCDSTATQTSKQRRLSRNSSTRLSDFDDDKKEITLLSVARNVGISCRRVSSGLRSAVGVLFVSRPKKPHIVCEAEVMEQASWITTNCVVSRLSTKQLMNRKVGLTPSEWYKSTHVINASFALETMYPKVYSNVSRKLCMTMSSSKVVTTTLGAMFKVLFEDSITWGKIVSMLTVAGLFAEECASQGHADFVKDVVEAVVDFTSAHLLSWLMSQGGWEAFPAPDVSDRSRLSKLRLLVLTGITAAVVMATSVFFDLWKLY